MKNWKMPIIATLVLFVASALPMSVAAQNSATVISGPELSKVVPTGFYFQGQSAPTQMRNASAARFGKNRYLIVGLVDTSGYAADVRARYEGFLITDSPISINGSELGIGAYGFGFSSEGKLNILDLAGNQILSLGTSKDAGLKRPRPLMLTMNGNDLRFYSGKDYTTIVFK